MTEGSHFQLGGLEVQFVETVSRKVVKVQEPMGKGPLGLGEELEEGAEGAALLLSLLLRWVLPVSYADTQFDSFCSFEPALPVAVLFVKADGESDGQGDYAGNRNHGDEADAPRSTSVVVKSVVAQTLHLLPFGTPDTPDVP